MRESRTSDTRGSLYNIYRPQDTYNTYDLDTNYVI